MTRVEVKPIDTSKWHGKKGKESFARPKKYNILVDPDTMRYATGLTEEEEKKYGAEINQDLSAHYDPNTPHPYWDGPLGTIKLENNTMFFDPNKVHDAIKIKNMKASKFVANSQKELEEGLWPEATHIIHDEAEFVEERASKAAIRHTAIVKSGKLSETRKLQIIMILTGKNLKGQSSDFVTVELSDLIDDEPQEVLRYIEQDSKEVASHALVLEAIQKNILRKVGHKVMYHDSILGQDELDVAQYLLADENQELKLRLMKAISE